MNSLHHGAKLFQIARNLPNFRQLTEDNSKLQETVTKLVKTNSELKNEVELLKNAASVSDKKTQSLIARLETAVKEKDALTEANAELKERLRHTPVNAKDPTNVQHATGAMVSNPMPLPVDTAILSTPSSSQRKAFLDGFSYSPDARLKKYWHKPFLTREDLEAMQADASASTQDISGLSPCKQNQPLPVTGAATSDIANVRTTARPHAPDMPAKGDPAVPKVNKKSKAPSGAPLKDHTLLQRRQSRRLRNEPPT